MKSRWIAVFTVLNFAQDPFTRNFNIIFRAFLASDEKNYQSKVNFGRLRPLRYQKTEKFKQPSNFLFNLLLCDTFYPLTQRNKSVVYEIDTRMEKIGKSVDQWVNLKTNVWEKLTQSSQFYPILPNVMAITSC